MKNLKNNKGFSLVELIIVVAIMAILIGILAPQYLKYVEKSRVTSDEDIIDIVRKAVETVASDPDVSLSKDKYVVTINNNGVDATITDTDFDGAFDAIVTGQSSRKWKSKTYKNKTVTVTLEFDTTNNMPKITVSDPTDVETPEETPEENPGEENH